MFFSTPPNPPSHPHSFTTSTRNTIKLFYQTFNYIKILLFMFNIPVIYHRFEIHLLNDHWRLLCPS